MFLTMKIKKTIPFVCQEIAVKKKHVHLSLIGEKGKTYYVLIKDFKIFMYNHFCRYILQPFNTEKILNCHIKDCCRISKRQRVIMHNKGVYI